MGSSQTKDINEEKEFFPSPSKAMTDIVSLTSSRKQVKSSKIFGIKFIFKLKRGIILFGNSSLNFHYFSKNHFLWRETANQYDRFTGIK